MTIVRHDEPIKGNSISYTMQNYYLLIDQLHIRQHLQKNITLNNKLNTAHMIKFKIRKNLVIKTIYSILNQPVREVLHI